MPLDKSKTKAAFKGNVKELLGTNRPINQALAIAYRLKGEKRPKK